VLAGFLITFVAAALFTVLAVALADGILVEIVFLALASTFTAPIPALVAAVLYFRLRELEDEGAEPTASVLEQPGDSLR
jgi:hypothetical protein